MVKHMRWSWHQLRLLPQPNCQYTPEKKKQQHTRLECRMRLTNFVFRVFFAVWHFGIFSLCVSIDSFLLWRVFIYWPSSIWIIKPLDFVHAFLRKFVITLEVWSRSSLVLFLHWFFSPNRLIFKIKTYSLPWYGYVDKNTFSFLYIQFGKLNNNMLHVFFLIHIQTRLHQLAIFLFYFLTPCASFQYNSSFFVYSN